jgi:nucleotide-binding universal stress UspA family protein
MYKHIAVGLDGSSFAAAAETVAIALAQRLGATVHGVHVIDTSFLEGAFITDISGAMGFEPFLDLGTQMRATLEELSGAIRRRFEEQCAAAGVPAAFHLERAGVVAGVLAGAKLADLLVLGKRGVNARLHEDLLGPTTELLLRRSPVPVVVVPEHAGQIRRPMAAYDGSPKAARALHHAAEMCRALSLPLTVVTVADKPERGQPVLDEARAYLAPHGLECEFRLEAGDAVEQVLLRLLGNGGYDAVLLGSHGHTRIVELVLGSTSQYLARKAAVPVICLTRA